ncbi:stabilizer of axonemal microtubules 4-like isoform X1 [Misgurnus anguillicaudatus]|uniref:stabilizer of axonemal microtubules 4-like isoform X1 n=1 Tax=Misgurnus anguillicaudatus TaxID=75329 RepID=UPI003CCF4194
MSHDDPPAVVVMVKTDRRKRGGVVWHGHARRDDSQCLSAMVGFLETSRPTGRLTNIGLDHYCTSYRHSYGKEFFQPCLGHHSGTGYCANHRPVLYYSSSLDHYDNPQFGLSLSDSFESQSKRHYRRMVLPVGKEALSCSGTKLRESGYLQLDSQPRARNVFWKSENKKSYNPHHLRVSVGRREESGYTEGINLQPNTFLPYHINMDDARRIQESVTRSDFLPKVFPQGSEALPKLSSCALRDTGFTRDTPKPLTTSVSAQGNSNESNRHKTRSPLVRWSIGPMSSSGFILNTPNITSLSHTSVDPQHFLTHYQSKFCDGSSVEHQRGEWMKGGVQMHRESGYSGRDRNRFYHILDS